MARPKSVITADLARRANEDLELLDQHKVIQKLRAIAASATYPIGNVAEVMGVAKETIWRWAKSYEKDGMEGLYPKPRRAKSSKLSPKQKQEVLQWIDNCETPEGKPVHWTLERLRQSIKDHYGITLGINTIWVWLRKEGCKLKTPRPRHYKGDAAAQADFKKNS
ncbi:helix-turn-helix domain-containing protein [Desulfatibacillum aliphaticivorans]|uniref:helix-turn-helix domain-containing protein n=1 Tax=Desulfatibacillum aliphaticivorans TaxID=218208 RepID=UPI000489E2F3|nr:helix-turn-helix domain-containing protein [Desulfatibacillum aliphaticivorans]